MGFAPRVAWPEPITWPPGVPKGPGGRGDPSGCPVRGLAAWHRGASGGSGRSVATPRGCSGCHTYPLARRSRWPQPWPQPNLERATGAVPELGRGAVPAVAGGDAAAAGLLARWVPPGRAPGTAAALGAIPEPPSPCLAGGDVTFDISNDAPTMAGAEATFSIALRFPSTQAVLPDGRVVWSQNCTVNGRRPPKTPPNPHLGARTPIPHNPPLTPLSPQAPASLRVTPSSRSSRPTARTASSPTGSRFPAAPGASVENSSTSGGRGVRPAATPAGARGGGVSPRRCLTPPRTPTPQDSTGRWWTAPRPG